MKEQLNIALSPKESRLLNREKRIDKSDSMYMAMMNIFEDLSLERESSVDTYKSMINILEDLQDEIVAKNKFLAVLSHELRNPLAPITSTLEFIKIQGVENDALKENINIIEHQFGILTRLLRDLLDIARINSNKLQLNIEAISLQATIRHAIHATQSSMNQAGHTFHVSLPEEEIRLMADALRLEQVVVNLISNAIKYTEPRGIIWLTAYVKNSTVMIEVKDTGIGISPHMISRIFNIFTQQEESSNFKGGLGIGLALVRSLIELHGGVVHASSEGKGQGSTFTVCLPIGH